MGALTRILSRPVNKPYRTKDLQHNEPPYLNEHGYLDFAPGDVENPREWSMTRRFFITVATVFLVMNATFASSAPSGCFPSIAESFHVSEEAAGLTITLFLLGYCAGPLIFAPLSELYGRRWIFYSTFTLYLAFNFLCAFAPNFGSLLVGRFLSGTFVSAPLSNGPGVLADLWNPIQRANAMGGFAAMLWIGPSLGPIIAGFLQLKKDWHWTFYVLLMLGGGSFLFMLTIPETHAPTVLRHKAKRLRKAKIPGYENVKAQIEDSHQNLASVYKVALTRPWIILFDPISFLIAIYLSVVYTLLYMLFTIYPIVFQEKRGWNSGVGELPLIGTVLGAMLGGLIVAFDTRRQQKKVDTGKKQLHEMTPEDRLPLAILGGITFAGAMFWFAWSANYNSVHWIVPTIAGAFLSTALLLLFVGFLNYLVDAYLMYAASAIAANTIMRSACGAAPLFTLQMFHALGVGGGGSLVGGVATVLAIIPFMFYKYGAAIRARSRFNPKGRKPAEKEDVETGPTPVVLEDPNEGGSEETESDDSSSSSTVAGDESGERNTNEKHPEHKQGEARERTEASASTEKVKEESP
ncbi:MFS general substrate transporter [Trichoderma citrinoviride]|uniref:MFS general substrate transporter n=1 Tax=Trichoderma citrinoviride TaxID=58853 RepID=A0A2T4BC37_9HYPO|nr:MFS general substrate transporter [Trichoderma citrinoviride]PTB66848.1 MFS general substrate transporter [Trichoderma citrinoviride]